MVGDEIKTITFVFSDSVDARTEMTGLWFEGAVHSAMTRGSLNYKNRADSHVQKKAKELIHKMSLDHRSTRTQLYLHKKS